MYPTPYGAYREHYAGQVEIDRRTFAQHATAQVSFALDFSGDSGSTDGTVNPGSSVVVSSDLDMRAAERSFTVRIDLTAQENGQPVGARTWSRVFPRDLA
jgi:hypothetical protein